jgi:hypothetical protein
MFNCIETENPREIWVGFWMKFGVYEINCRELYRYFTYEVWLWSSRNDFIASVSVYLQLTERVIFEVLSLSSCAYSPTMLPLLETFFELLLWNSFQFRRHMNIRPFKADFVSETARSHSEPYQGNKVGVPFQ